MIRETLGRSWALVKASAAVLRADRQLLLFPVISAVATLVVLATFLIPLSLAGLFARGGVWLLLPALAFYVCQYAVVMFFNAALVGAAMIRLDGGDPTLSDGMEAARRRLPAILGYAAIAATVGVLLQVFRRQRSGWLGHLLGSGLGVAWTLATFLVVPVLVQRQVGPVEALRQSLTLFRSTWGENAVGTIGLGAAFGLMTTAIVVFGVLAVVLAAQVWVGLAILLGGLVVIAALLMGVVRSALGCVYAAVLYRHATTGEVPAAFRRLARAQPQV